MIPFLKKVGFTSMVSRVALGFVATQAVGLEYFGTSGKGQVSPSHAEKP